MSNLTMAMASAAMMAAGIATGSAQPALTVRTQVMTDDPLPGQIRVRGMTGAPVYDSQNQDIGSIKDIVLEPDGRVAAVGLNVRGTLGMGGRYVAVGINDLKITDAGAKPRFTVLLLKGQLKTAQTYDLRDADRAGGAAPPPPPDDRPPPADPER